MQKLLQSKYFQTITLIPLILTVSSCASTTFKNQNLAPSRHINTIQYPNIDQQLGEKLYPNEQMIANEISDIIEKNSQVTIVMGDEIQGQKEEVEKLEEYASDLKTVSANLKMALDVFTI